MIYSTLLLNLSVYPSVCGWYALLILILQFSSFISDYQKTDWNLVSLSLIILSGIPNLHTQLSKNNCAVWTADISVFVGIKIVYLLKRSIIANILSKPFFVVGSYTIKSIVTCSNGLVGTTCGYNKPGVRCVLVLFAWHVLHCAINFRTSARRPFHQKRFYINLFILK